MRKSPAKVLLLGYISIILFGSFLLYLPISHTNIGIKYIDALFTATSAMCVTGLTVVSTASRFSFFGKLVVITLIQIGGLGFMTFVSLFLMFLGKKIKLKERILIQESFNQYTSQGLVKMTKRIFSFAFIMESVGAFFLAFQFIPKYGIGKGIAFSIFHAISAFCNAGFDLIGDSSLAPFRGSYLLNLTLMVLIVLGGIGFYVIKDLYETIQNSLFHRKNIFSSLKRLNLHSKIVMITTAVLILIGTILIFVIESYNPNTMASLPIPERILASLFHSISARTAGFFTIPLSHFTNSSKFVIILLMTIGGSPVGTAGGIKTITLAVLLITIFSILDGDEKTVVFGKTIPLDSIKKALAVFFLGISVIIFGTMLLNISENCSFMEALFEVTSAFSTTGLSLGITASLTVVGKLILICLMVVGRAGLFTVALSLLSYQNRGNNLITYPEEKIIIG